MENCELKNFPSKIDKIHENIKENMPKVEVSHIIEEGLNLMEVEG